MSKNTVFLYGLHTVQALLQHQPERIRYLIQQENRQDERIQAILKLAKAAGISVQSYSRAALDKMLAEQNHQGIVACCNEIETWQKQDLTEIIRQAEKPPLLLLLDNVQDPHNLGACLRVANAAGVAAVVIPRDRSASLTAVASKVAAGAAAVTPVIYVTNLARTIEELKAENVWVYGLAAEAKRTIYQHDWRGPTALVLGAEGQGLRQLTKEKCDDLLSIPMLGTVDSLNVATAAAVGLFEAVRQRLN